jgi:hypothetical protein
LLQCLSIAVLSFVQSHWQQTVVAVESIVGLRRVPNFCHKRKGPIRF